MSEQNVSSIPGYAVVGDDGIARWVDENGITREAPASNPWHDVAPVSKPHSRDFTIARRGLAQAGFNGLGQWTPRVPTQGDTFEAEKALGRIEEQLEGALQVATNYQGNYSRLQEQLKAAQQDVQVEADRAEENLRLQLEARAQVISLKEQIEGLLAQWRDYQATTGDIITGLEEQLEAAHAALSDVLVDQFGSGVCDCGTEIYDGPRRVERIRAILEASGAYRASDTSGASGEPETGASSPASQPADSGGNAEEQFRVVLVNSSTTQNDESRPEGRPS